MEAGWVGEDRAVAEGVADKGWDRQVEVQVMGNLLGNRAA
jgi:hypothetical protein